MTSSLHVGRASFSTNTDLSVEYSVGSFTITNTVRMASLSLRSFGRELFADIFLLIDSMMSPSSGVVRTSISVEIAETVDFGSMSFRSHLNPAGPSSCVSCDIRMRSWS